MVMFFVFDLVSISINPYTTFQTTFWPDLIMPLYHIILIKVHTFGNHSVKNNEEINARVYLTDDITEHFMIECFLKVQTLIKSICGIFLAGK